MAPIKKRTSMRARTSSTKPTSTAINSAAPATDSSLSAADLASLRLKKQDKRQLKHAALMHRVRDAAVSKQSAAKKRRRPGKKMLAAESLGGLKDALPEIAEDEDDEWEGLSDEGMEQSAGDGATTSRKRRKRAAGEGKIKMNSLKHRPGAMKRKQALERREQDRFARNLAQLAEKNASATGTATAAAPTAGTDGGGDTGQAGKWAALRSFIGSTLEKDKAFGR